MSVLVFGSINLDLVARSVKLPIPGETVSGQSFETVPGGKGANQAVAVARLGVPTELIGRVGGDAFGQQLLQSLRDNHVQCDRVTVDPTTHSGVALINVDSAGENTITVIPGANGQIDRADLLHLEAALPSASVLLLQLEIPLAIVRAAAQMAHRVGVRVILDPAPAVANLPAELYPAIDVITPNQTEASQLVGFPVDRLESAIAAAQELRQRGASSAIVKLGRQGAVCVTATDTVYLPIFPVQTVDTVAAGDAFNGGLAAGLAQALPLEAAALQAAAVAALAVTQRGAQSAMPTQSRLNTFLTRYPTVAIRRLNG